ncbi:MAG: GtrA family protein [Propionibacteriales bacterium]|nr:GtrA family protein [Propionibacteriales bacterium]
MPSLQARLQRLAHELAKFATVGLLGYVVDITVFNLLRYDGASWPAPLADKPITAKVISVTVATLVTYAGNRHWTWRDRSRRGIRREYAAFFLLNGIGMLIAVACLAVSHYVLGYTSALADNIAANVVGLALGTVFRFWSYRTYVFVRPRPRPDSASD